MHTSVREVDIPSEPDSSYFLRVDWSGRGLGSGFQLLLTDGQDAWRGDGKNVTRRDLTACRVTFNTSDLTDLCSPDTFTWTSPVWPHAHTHLSHFTLGHFRACHRWPFRLLGQLHSEEDLLVSLRCGFKTRCWKHNRRLSIHLLFSSVGMRIVRICTGAELILSIYAGVYLLLD